MFFKAEKIRDKEHTAFVKTLPCLKCGSNHNIDPAHVRKGTDGGMGTKPSDCYVVPLCHTDHAIQHQIGELSFWIDVERTVKVALELYENTGDRVTCLGIIAKNRPF